MAILPDGTVRYGSHEGSFIDQDGKESDTEFFDDWLDNPEANSRAAARSAQISVDDGTLTVKQALRAYGVKVTPTPK